MQASHVLVTRPAHQAENLATLLAGQGMVAVLFPTLAIAGLADLKPVVRAFENMDNYQWLIFISANAVNFALQANGGKIPHSNRVHFAAVGQATAHSLKVAGLPVDVVPEQGFNSEALLAMPQMQDLSGQQVLIVRGVGGREELANTLRSRGAQVDYLEVYQRVVPTIDKAPIIELLMQNKLDVVTVTSAEALQNLLTMLGESHKLLFNLPLIVVSERIKIIAAEMGFKRIVVAEGPSDAAILDTVKCL